MFLKRNAKFDSKASVPAEIFDKIDRDSLRMREKTVRLKYRQRAQVKNLPVHVCVASKKSVGGRQINASARSHRTYS